VVSAHGTRHEISSDTWSEKSGVVQKYNGSQPRSNRTFLVLSGELTETEIVELTAWKFSGVAVEDRIIVAPRAHKKDSNGGSIASNKCATS
jgi:hypothetical protein